MIIKEFTSKDTCGKNRLFVEVECDVCLTIFTRQKRLLKDHTCTSQCNSLMHGNSVELICDHCNSIFIRSNSKLLGSKSGKYFCCRKCKDTAQSYMAEIQPAHYNTGTGIHTYRDKAFKTYLPICAVCGFSNKAALEVHHIDRNRNNNNIDNLRILCANCHLIEHQGH